VGGGGPPGWGGGGGGVETPPPKPLLSMPLTDTILQVPNKMRERLRDKDFLY